MHAHAAHLGAVRVVPVRTAVFVANSFFSLFLFFCGLADGEIA